MPHYADLVRVGLSRVAALGDGYTINLSWFPAYPDLYTNQIAYHIYYSGIRQQVFLEGVKAVVIDGSTEVNIIDLTPGQEYFFCVRPVEYNPAIFDLSNLPISHDNVRYYPSSLLSRNMTATDLVVPLLDVTGFPSMGVVQIGIELILYLAVDAVNNNLIIPGGTSPSGGYLVLQSNDEYYLPNPSNVGSGTINNLTLVGADVSETWTIKCIWVQRDASGNPIPGTAQFQAMGSKSSTIIDGYGDWFIWQVNGSVVSNGVLSFSITETTTFDVSDYFTVQVAGVQPGNPSGRGYNNTPITAHYINGFDGYYTYNPLVFVTTIVESTLYDQIYACLCRFEYPNFPFTLVDGYKQVTSDYLSTDYAAADAANIGFPMYDYAGYHRTDPVQLLNGTCVGSYIGGEMGCIDANGNYNIYRGFSLQDQNTQREDILLSVTGQPACLIQRQQTGDVCSCYLSTSEYPDDRCPFCFVPGTLVSTETGFRPIEQIKVGERVLSGDGLYHPVLRVFERHYEGTLQSITSTVSTNPILATPEHPFLVMRGSHGLTNTCGPNSNCKSFITRGNGARTSTPKKHASGKYQARAQLKGKERVHLGMFDTLEEAHQAIHRYYENGAIPGHMLDWDESQNISKNNWLVSKWSDEIRDVDVVDIPQEYRKNTKLGKQRLGSTQFIVDEEFLWMIGMYIAEGSHSKRSISFALHVKEKYFSSRLVSYFTKQGYHPVVYKSKSTKGMVVAVNSATLAQWFPKWLGALCDSKHIPEELMKLPSNKAWAIIRGIHDGDGSKRENEITQTSEILALQLSELLHRVGEQPLVSQYINHNLTENGNKRKKAYRINWKETTLTHHNRKGRWDYEGQLLAKVRKTEKIPKYSGPVYNLEVEGDHTYVVQGVVVHNCYGTKFVFGYTQYFNPRRSDGRILVRLGPTAENLKMHEAGLESEFPLDIWTLTVPTIKTRDILVLFDQDDNESFRYEVSDVTRNQTILGQDGRQNLKTFRIRKTDPAYQVRIFSDTSDFPNTLTTSLGMAPPAIPPHSHSIVVNENVLAVSQINQTTGVSQGHSHVIVNGVVLPILSHSHTILLP